MPRFALSLLAGCFACSSGPVVELTFAPEVSKAWITELRIVAIDSRSPVLIGDQDPSCAELTALEARQFHRDLREVGRPFDYPLSSGEAQLDVEGAPSSAPVLVHVVASGPARPFVGDVVREDAGGAELQPEREFALAEACVCIGTEPGCQDPDAPAELILGDLLAGNPEVKVTPVGPTALVAVRGTRALLSPGVRVFAPACTSDGAPGCLTFPGAPKLDGLPLSVRVDGDETSAPVAAVIVTNAAGDAIPEVQIGACPSGRMRVVVGLIGHPTAFTTFDVACTDDLLASRTVSVAEIAGDARLAVVPPGGLAVLSGRAGSSELSLYDLASAPARKTSSLMFAGEDLGDVIGFSEGGEPRVATVTHASGVIQVRTFRATGGQLVETGASSGDCPSAVCGAITGQCSMITDCKHGATARLDAGDVDGDGRTEISLLSSGGGITLYAPDLASCRRLSGLGTAHIAHAWAKLGGPVPELPVLVAFESFSVRINYPEQRSATGPACTSDAECTGGATCHVACPGGATCTGGLALTTGVCLTVCTPGVTTCPSGTACTAVSTGGAACLGPGPSCLQGDTILTNATNGSRSVKRGRFRPGDFDDVVLLARSGVPRILLGAPEVMGGRAIPARDAFLTPRTITPGKIPRDARAHATADVNADGLDDLVVGYDSSVRTWLGGDGLPGEATEVPITGCAVRGVALPVVRSHGRAAVVLVCGDGMDSTLRMIER